MKVVRFHPILETIGYTYSSTDYDRSLFSIPDFNTSRKSHHTLPFFNTNHVDDASSSSSIIDMKKNNRPIITPLDFSKLSTTTTTTATTATKRPKLKINTKMTNDPLFFTHLSTHYKFYSQDICNSSDDDDDDIYPSKNFNLYESSCLSTY
ncbi:hypothetical protein BJ944DRAFT_268677 [Cunninghamella echinulata]|nr:hypothetical protein BJ944DRAFT_268677 [Cunninghamella echinulata]